jgi:hypothetical protein
VANPSLEQGRITISSNVGASEIAKADVVASNPAIVGSLERRDLVVDFFIM